MSNTRLRYFFSGCALVVIALSLSRCQERKEAPLRVQIFAVNDIHAAIEKFPRLAFVVDSLRAIYPDLLVVSGGDNQTGNPVNDWASEKGMPIIELMDRVGFDISALGNHEFDVSAVQMRKNFSASRCTYLCANAVSQDSGYPLQRHRIVELSNGLKVAFSSLLYINAGGIPDSHPTHTVGFTFLDPLKEGIREYDTLRQQSDVLVFLNHLGYEWDQKLAEVLPSGGADVIIGGHSHTLIRKPEYFNSIMITQAGSNLAWGSFIELTRTDSGTTCKHQLIRVGGAGIYDVGVKKMVDSLTTESGFSEVIAVTGQGIKGKERMGYLMADGQRAFAKADIAIMNPGGVRISELAPGDITVLDIYRLDPFGNEIVEFEMTLAELREFIEKASMTDYNDALIPSGMHLRYSYDEGAEGSRTIKRVELLDTEGRPLQEGLKYRVVMNSYISSAYDFPCRERGKSLKVTTATATIEWLKEQSKAPDYTDEQRVERVMQ